MFAITTLSTLRMGVGTALLAAPELSAKMFFLPLLPGATIVTRMTGSRDLALGALTLYLARQTSNKASGENTHAYRGIDTSSEAAEAAGASPTTSLLNNGSTSSKLRDPPGGDGVGTGYVQAMGPLLATNIAVDAMDVLACLWCLEEGNLNVEPALLFGGGATLFMGLGIFALTRRRRTVLRN